MAVAVGDPIRFTVSTGDRPMSLNLERREHWTAHTRMTKEWKAATAQQLGLNRVQPLMIYRYKATFRPAFPPSSKDLPDTGNIYPTTKAILDAAVDHGLLVEDKPGHNAAEIQLEPVEDEDLQWPVVDVLITPLEPVEGHRPGECGCRERYEAARLKRELGRR